MPEQLDPGPFFCECCGTRFEVLSAVPADDICPNCKKPANIRNPFPLDHIDREGTLDFGNVILDGKPQKITDL